MIPCLGADDLPAPPDRGYHAMYSSWFGGIVTDPGLMMVPVDDHLVHRGDGVFETVKSVNGRLWLLDAHLDRLAVSADAIDIDLPWSAGDLAEILEATVRAGGTPTCMLRVLVSRGPGGFSVNPYESTGPHLYVVAYPARPPFMQTHPEGARAACSEVPVKPGILARAKTCNYLTNALMKKEAVDAGIDFVIGIDPEGRVTESYTENLCIVARDGVLCRPQGDHILAGTTMERCLELAAEAGIPTAVRPFTVDDLRTASEVLIFGTTAEVTVVTDFEGQAFTPGPVFRELARRLRAEMYGEAL